MNLRQALDALHRAGRIRSPVLPGMMVDDMRCIAACADGRQLWITSYDSEIVEWWWTTSQPDDLDTSDYASIGCLAALAREASGRPGLFAAYISEPPEVWEIAAWDPENGMVDAWGGSPTRGLTEGEAWAAAIIAMAEAIGHRVPVPARAPAPEADPVQDEQVRPAVDRALNRS